MSIIETKDKIIRIKTLDDAELGQTIFDGLDGL